MFGFYFPSLSFPYSSKHRIFVLVVFLNFGFHLFLLHFGAIESQEKVHNIQIFQSRTGPALCQARGTCQKAFQSPAERH